MSLRPRWKVLGPVALALAGAAWAGLEWMPSNAPVGPVDLVTLAPAGGDEFSSQCANLFAAGNLCQPF